MTSLDGWGGFLQEVASEPSQEGMRPGWTVAELRIALIISVFLVKGINMEYKNKNCFDILLKIQKTQRTLIEATNFNQHCFASIFSIVLI